MGNSWKILDGYQEVIIKQILRYYYNLHQVDTVCPLLVCLGKFDHSVPELHEYAWLALTAKSPEKLWGLYSKYFMVTIMQTTATSIAPWITATMTTGATSTR